MSDSFQVQLSLTGIHLTRIRSGGRLEKVKSEEKLDFSMCVCACVCACACIKMCLNICLKRHKGMFECHYTLSSIFHDISCCADPVHFGVCFSVQCQIIKDPHLQ